MQAYHQLFLDPQSAQHQQQQQSQQLNTNQPKVSGTIPPRKKTYLFVLANESETVPVPDPQPTKPKEEVVKPVVEETKHESKTTLLFEVVPKVKTEADKFNNLLADEFDKYLVPAKLPDQRKKYSVDEMNRIANHPYTKRKRSGTAHEEIFQNMKLRGNYKPKPPGINLDLDIKLETVEKKFMPEKMMGNAAADISSEDRLLRELKAILNRLMEDNLAASVDEIKAKQVQTAEHQVLLAKAVFESAARQSKFSRVFASLTAQFWSLEEFKKGIMNLMRGSVDRTLQQHLDETNKTLDDQLQQETDSTVRKIFEERRETVLSKTEENYFGCMTFMAELYRADRFSDTQLLQILNRFVEKLDPSTARSFDIVMTIAGKTLDNKEHRKVDDLFAKLHNQIKKVTLSSYLLYHLDQLVKRRAGGWPEAPKPEKVAVATTQPSTGGGGGSGLMSINPSNLAQQSEKLRPKTRWGEGCQTKNQMPGTVAPPKQTTPKTEDEYRQALNNLRGDPILLFQSKDPKLVEDLQTSYAPAFVHFVVDLVLNKKTKERYEAGTMFEYAPEVDDFLEDCPKLFTCVGEIFYPLLHASSLTDCTFLVQACKELQGQRSSGEGLETLFSAVQLAMKNDTTANSIRAKLGPNLKMQLMQEMRVNEEQFSALCERFGAQEVVTDVAATASWKVQSKTGRKSKTASAAGGNKRGADLLAAVATASPDDLKSRMGSSDDMPPLNQFSNKLFKRSGHMPKEQMESFVNLLQFYNTKKLEHQQSFLSELDRCEGLDTEHRKAVLECLLAMRIVSKEAMNRYGQRGGGGGTLSSLIKSNFSNGTSASVE
ncbi:Eukaryotic translation initiation factor 4 gamma [Cichlidogyrus casuarinus]|uniref:Eukaryotic translation initiation factor 4 gamma n=1 Tax=Cichlidogyrus casuarinus TaxID=1844966 RepID=A0ABD2QJG2_9PLAT